MIYLTAGAEAIRTASTWLPILERAIDRSDGRWSREEVLDDVRNGLLLVWIMVRHERVVGVFTTRPITCRSFTWVLVEDLAGDDIDGWLPEAARALEGWARELGAKQIMLEGRRGWERKLRALGYETKRIQAVKHLVTVN